MKVRAIEKGYYGDRERVIGEIFILKPRVRKVKVKNKDGKVVKVEKVAISPEDQFSKNWMEKVVEGPARRPSSNYPKPGEVGVRSAHEPPADDENDQEQEETEELQPLKSGSNKDVI